MGRLYTRSNLVLVILLRPCFCHNIFTRFGLCGTLIYTGPLLMQLKKNKPAVN